MDSKTLALITSLVLAATGAMMAFNPSELNKISADFENYKVKYGKQYANEKEEAYRFAVWSKNMNEINEHNKKNTETYTKGENQFTDITQEEFKSIYLGYKGKKTFNNVDLELANTEPNGEVNWVKKGAVQKVKDQGQCGSCWAFSAVASCESLKFIDDKKLGDFAEQQLVDCDKVDAGCNGGLMDNAFNYFKKSGICTEASYKYTAKDGKCKASSCTKDSFKITGYTDVPAGSVKGLKAACDKQPVSIAVDAEKWSSYSSGIFSNCGTSLDHGVLLAGYGSDHWLVKNSWGTSWGENGYIRLAPGNTCGLANSASVPK